MALTNEQLETSKRIEAKTTDNGDVIRHGIAQLLKDPYFQKTLDKEALKNYQDLVDKKGHVNPDDTESLSRFYGFMKNQFEDVKKFKKKITDHVEQAIREKVITEKDRIFYKKKMKENVLSGKQIVTREILKQAEKDILESLENRRKERKEYDDLVNSPINQDGFLHIDKNDKIQIVDEQGYLGMSVPERRKWLKKIREALPKAKKYAEKQNGIESEKLEKEYKALLDEARKEGVIGLKTIRKFMDGFKKINLKEKEYWIQEMENGNQLKRYQDLWTDIRKTLKGPALKRMEGLRDKMGYTELLQEFGRFCEKESSRIVGEYEKKLENAYQQKVISKHTKLSFLQDIRNQPLKEQQQYLEDFDKEMERYETLRSKIDQLKDKRSQKVLNEMYESNEYGYSEIQAKYNRLTGQASDGQASLSQEKDRKILNSITNETIKEGIIEADEKLNKTQKKTFVERLTHYFSGKHAEEQDASDYQKKVQAARLEQEKELIKDKIDETPESRVKIKTTPTDSFESRTYVGTEENKRVVRLDIDSRTAVQTFNNEALLNCDRDELSIMTWDGKNDIELEMREIRIMQKYLKENLESSQEDVESEKEAA